MRAATPLLLAVLLLCAACERTRPPSVAGVTPMRGLRVSVVAEGLASPTDVHMGPLGRLTIVEAGAGRVVELTSTGSRELVTGFRRGGAIGVPVAAAWVDEEVLAVIRRGATGADRIGYHRGIFAEVDDGADEFRGPVVADEAELSHPAKGKDGARVCLVDLCALQGAVYAIGRDEDGRAWVLRGAPGIRELEPFAVVDPDELDGLVPTAILPFERDAVRALFSGDGDEEEARLVSWNASTGDQDRMRSYGDRQRSWRLPRLAAGAGAIVEPDEENVCAIGPSPRGELLMAILHRRRRWVDSAIMAEGVAHAVSATSGPNGVVYVLESGPDLGRLLLFELE